MTNNILTLALLLTVLLVSSASAVAPAPRSRKAGWSLPVLFQVRGGESADYIGQLDAVKNEVLKKAFGEIDAWRREIVLEGKTIDDFGSKADQLCNQVLEEFASAAPDGDDDGAFDRKVQELEASVDAPLHVLYLKQLVHLREAALQRYRAASKSNIGEYEAMLQADAEFLRNAESCMRSAGGAEWDYSQERSYLQAVMNGMGASSRQAAEVQQQAASQQQTAMQFLQSQQQMIQQLQQQLYGQTSPWNVGVAYRIPDTNFNLQGSYQQGRTSVQVSCVPDEYAPMLGPNGFTQGVGPGNLGLSLNLSV